MLSLGSCEEAEESDECCAGDESLLALVRVLCVLCVWRVCLLLCVRCRRAGFVKETGCGTGLRMNGCVG